MPVNMRQEIANSILGAWRQSVDGRTSEIARESGARYDAVLEQIGNVHANHAGEINRVHGDMADDALMAEEFDECPGFERFSFRFRSLEGKCECGLCGAFRH